MHRGTPMTKYESLFVALASPFEADEVRARTQGGRQLPYVTARVVMNRLDEVLGPENWWDEYTPGENSVLCRLTVRLPDGSALTKCDAGGYAGMADSGDDDKSGYSDAFKRAAVKFGVARYLYRDGLPPYVRAALGEVVEAAQPHQAEPRHDQPQPARPDGQRQQGGGQPPRSGKALFAWTKEQEQKYDVGLLKYLNEWSKLQDYPGRMVDWDEPMVALAYAEACRKLKSLESQHADAN